VTRRRLLVAALIFGSVAACASYRAPIPGVNEPQYLCKAKHFWNRDWCARDFFLISADAHYVFYFTIGALTRFFSLEQTAWIGRILLWAGLAISWTRLAGRLLGQSLAPLWSACIFLALQASGNLAGEWLIGGVEAKGFAYAALLVAIEAASSGSVRRASAASGAAVSLHPVVGLWGALALAAASWPNRRTTQGGGAGSWQSAMVSGLLWITFALPGLVPALIFLANRPSPEISNQADRIQVFDRLKHHLDPRSGERGPAREAVQREFSRGAYLAYGALLGFWLLGRRLVRHSEAESFFARFVLATLAIAAAGLVIGLGPRWPGLMKYYPFRLLDVFLPIAVAMTAVGLFERIADTLSAGRFRRTAARWLAPAAGCAALVWAIAAPGRIANAANWKKPGNWEAFVDACLWIERNTPRDALFLTPKRSVGFKWYAQRAEFATWKDCPQDAAGIVDWNRRLKRIERWRSKHFDGGFSEAALGDLENRTGIDYILGSNEDPWQVEPMYRNKRFSVYSVPK